MDVSTIKVTAPLPITGIETRARLAWEAGNILEATVIVAKSGELTLEVAGSKIQAQSNLQFVPGQRLRLQVTESGKLPILRLLDNHVSTNLTVQMRTFRSALPYQAPIAPVIDNLMQLINNTAKTEQTPRNNLLNLATEIINHFPQLSEIKHPDTIKQLFQKSGLFLEANLASLSFDNNLDLDFKAQLLRLEEALQNTVASIANETENTTLITHDKNEKTEMLAENNSLVTKHANLIDPELIDKTAFEFDRNFIQNVHGALARLTVNQLNLAETGMMNLEIPIRNGENWSMLNVTIEENDGSYFSNEEHVRPWTATLRFNLVGLGTILTKITVAKEVSVLFQTELQEASKAFNHHLDKLRDALIKAGLSPGQLIARTAVIPDLVLRLPSVPLLDEQV